MELLTDVAFLSRVQFALVVFVHFVFVPLSIGIGLIMAINETRYYRSRNPKDEAATRFWVKIFTTTFAVGVATGITMEFSFGTNWADYSRFVGDIFGAPLAAEALLAFFLESVFLGIVIFGAGVESAEVLSCFRLVGLLRQLPVRAVDSYCRTPGCRLPQAPSLWPTAARRSLPTSSLRRSIPPRFPLHPYGSCRIGTGFFRGDCNVCMVHA